MDRAGLNKVQMFSANPLFGQLHFHIYYSRLQLLVPIVPDGCLSEGIFLEVVHRKKNDYLHLCIG